eukprot:g1749.t1
MVESLFLFFLFFLNVASTKEASFEIVQELHKFAYSIATSPDKDCVDMIGFRDKNNFPCHEYDSGSQATCGNYADLAAPSSGKWTDITANEACCRCKIKASHSVTIDPALMLTQHGFGESESCRNNASFRDALGNSCHYYMSDNAFSMLIKESKRSTDDSVSLLGALSHVVRCSSARAFEVFQKGEKLSAVEACCTCGGGEDPAGKPEEIINENSDTETEKDMCKCCEKSCLGRKDRCMPCQVSTEDATKEIAELQRENFEAYSELVEKFQYAFNWRKECEDRVLADEEEIEGLMDTLEKEERELNKALSLISEAEVDAQSLSERAQSIVREVSEDRTDIGRNINPGNVVVEVGEDGTIRVINESESLEATNEIRSMVEDTMRHHVTAHVAEQDALTAEEREEAAQMAIDSAHRLQETILAHTVDLDELGDRVASLLEATAADLDEHQRQVDRVLV